MSAPGDFAAAQGSMQAVYIPVALNFKPNRAEITYRLELENTGSGTATRLDVYVAIPQARTNQQVLNLVFNLPYTQFVDQYGQPVAHFQFTNVGPGQKAVVEWQADAAINAIDFRLDPIVTAGLDQIPPEIISQYTSNETMYRLESSIIQNAASEAAGGAVNLYWLVRNIHDFVAERLAYVDDDRWDDAETVYLQQHGSCTEYTYLFVALCRANGIPARLVGATMQRGPGTSVDTSYHRWAEVYLPPYGWVPVDVQADDGATISHDRFGALLDNGFVTTIGGGSSVYLNWNYHDRYTYVASGIVNLKRVRTFTWVDQD